LTLCGSHTGVLQTSQASNDRRGQGAIAFLAACVFVVVGAGAAADEPDEAERKVFKVCADPNNLPFSNQQGEGYENKLAELFGREMGLPVETYFQAQRLNFVRNTLRFKLPGEDYRCDIMMGVPVGFEQVATTRPYYRSTYVLVYIKGRGLDAVNSVADFLALPREQLRRLKIGVFDRSPASQWLKNHDLVDSGVPYQMMNARPDYYPGEIVEKDLVQGKVDVAVLWGPIAGFAATRVKDHEVVVVPMPSEPGVKFDYQVAMGVRHGETKWKQHIDGLIESKLPQIREILQSYRIPLQDP
jgi:quinoprotein dehydrogenase-associated probable ABC transporter substrate-binding protein